MTQVLSWITVLGLLSVLRVAPPPASFAPDEDFNGPALYGERRGPSPNGTDALEPRVRGFAVVGVELADGIRLSR